MLVKATSSSNFDTRHILECVAAQITCRKYRICHGALLICNDHFSFLDAGSNWASETGTKTNVYTFLSSTNVEVFYVVASVHFKSLDAGDKKKELDSEFEQQRKAVIEAAVQQQTQSARTTANSSPAKQVGWNGRIASVTAEWFHYSMSA